MGLQYITHIYYQGSHSEVESSRAELSWGTTGPNCFLLSTHLPASLASPSLFPTLLASTHTMPPAARSLDRMCPGGRPFLCHREQLAVSGLTVWDTPTHRASPSMAGKGMRGDRFCVPLRHRGLQVPWEVRHPCLEPKGPFLAPESNGKRVTFLGMGLPRWAHSSSVCRPR